MAQDPWTLPRPHAILHLSTRFLMDPNDFQDSDPLEELIDAPEWEDIEYDDSAFGAMLESSNDF